MFGLSTILPLIPSLLSTALTNDAVIAGIKSVASSGAITFLESIGGMLFPKVKPALRLAAAAFVGVDADTVKWIQSSINYAMKDEPDFVPLVVDGIFGQKSQDATEALQRKYGLYVDGFPGEKTKGLLAAIVQGFSVKVFSV